MRELSDNQLLRNLTAYSVIALSFLIFLSLPVTTGDTYELILGSTGFGECVSQNNTASCADLERFGFTPHLVSFLLLQLYPNPDVVIVLWSILNFLAFLLASYIVFQYIFIQYPINRDSFLFFSGLIFSPIIAYAAYSFSEMTYVTVSILFIHFLYRDKIFYASIFGILAIAFKDNAFLTILPLTLAVLFFLKINFLKKVLYVFLIGMGLIINLYFNLIRYQTLSNSVYQTEGTIFSIPVNINNLLALWISPSGGVLGYLFFLPILIVIFLIKLIPKADRTNTLIIICLLLPIFLMTLNLAFWYSPFGWVAWGPRLILPTLVISIFTSFIFLKEAKYILSFSWRVFQRRIYYLFSYMSLIMSLGFLVNPGVWNIWYQKVNESGSICGTMPVWEVNPQGFLDCNFSMMWTVNSLPLNSIIELINFFEADSIFSVGKLIYFFAILVISLPFLFTLIVSPNSKRPAASSIQKS